jgi:hypothetical protein
MLTISGDFGPGRPIWCFWQMLFPAFAIVGGWPVRRETPLTRSSIGIHGRARKRPWWANHAGPRTQLRMSPDHTIKDVRFSKPVDVPPYHYGVVFERT